MPKVKDLTKKPKSVQKRLSSQEKHEMAVMWATGDYTQEELGKKFNVSSQSVYNNMRAMKIEKGSMKEALKEQASKAISQKMSEEVEKLMEDAIQSKKMAVKASLGYQRLSAQLIKKATDEGKALASIAAELKTLDLATKIQGDAYKNVAHALGLDKNDIGDDDLEELTFYDLDKEDILEMRKQQEEEAAIMNGTMDDSLADIEDMSEFEEEEIE